MQLVEFRAEDFCFRLLVLEVNMVACVGQVGITNDHKLTNIYL